MPPSRLSPTLKPVRAFGRDGVPLTQRRPRETVAQRLDRDMRVIPRRVRGTHAVTLEPAASNRNGWPGQAGP